MSCFAVFLSLLAASDARLGDGFYSNSSDASNFSLADPDGSASVPNDSLQSQEIEVPSTLNATEGNPAEMQESVAVPVEVVDILSGVNMSDILDSDDVANNISAQWGRKSRLRIRNSLKSEPIWIAHCCNYPYRQNVKINPGAVHEFPVWPGLSGMRFWPKMLCRNDGNGCLVGQSGGQNQPCGSGSDWRCHPHIDTKFEVTFGHHADYWDLSAVDGFTLPAKVTLSGTDCKVPGSGQVLDCSGLKMDACPLNERLSGKVTDLRLQWQGRVAGCFSPCTKAQWMNFRADHPFARPYCCPNPPVNRNQCLSGPMPRTQFVRNVRSRCTRIYTFSYDDDFGNLNCRRGTTYEVAFFDMF